MSKELISKGNNFVVEWLDRKFGGRRRQVISASGVNGDLTLDGAHFSDKLSADLNAWVVADPGTGKAIDPSKSGVCLLESAGAETRTLARPAFVGQKLALICNAYVGNIVLTVAGTVNQTGNNTLTFGAAADMIELTGMKVGDAMVWRVTANDGVALSTV